MTAALNMPSLNNLEQYRAAARSFVWREQQIIRIVAHELLRVRYLTGDELSILLSGF